MLRVDLERLAPQLRRLLAVVPLVGDVAELEVDVVSQVGRELDGPAVGVPGLIVARAAIREVAQVLGQLGERGLVLARFPHQVLRGRQVARELLQHREVIAQRRVRWVGLRALLGEVLGHLELAGARRCERARPEPCGRRHPAEQLPRPVEPARSAGVVLPLQGDDTPPEIHLGVGPGARRGLAVGRFRLVQPPELLVGEREVMEHGRAATPALGCRT